MHTLLQNYRFSVYLKEESKELIALYLKRFKSPKTQLNYCSAINGFFDFVKKDIREIGSSDCIRYIEFLESRRDAGRTTTSTITKKRYQVSSLFSYLNTPFAKGKLKLSDSFCNYFLDIRMDAPPQSIRYDKIPSIKELDVLHCYLMERDPMIGIAVLLAFKGFLTTQQFRNLSVTDFYLDANDKMIVQIKNPAFALDRRYNSIPDDVKELLLSYFDTLGIRQCKLFAKKNGSLYTDRTLCKRLKNACFECGIPSYTFNDLRNAGAAFALSYRAELSVVANSLGHRTTRHIKRLESMQIAINDAAEYMGISFRVMQLL